MTNKLSFFLSRFEYTETDDVSLSSINSSINPYDLEQISTPKIKDNSNDTPLALNENDVLNNGFALRYLKNISNKNNIFFFKYFSETFSLKSDLR